jgi:hypothetical protein
MKPNSRSLTIIFTLVSLFLLTFGLAYASSPDSRSNAIPESEILEAQINSPSSVAANATIHVAHFAPFSDTEIGTSVTVRVNGADAITDFTFGEVFNTTLPAGTYLIEILPTGTNTVVISGSVSVEDDKAYTLAAIGDGANQSLELFPLVDNTTPAADVAKLRVAHLAPFASGEAEVDICTDEGALVIKDLEYKDVTDPYLELPAGDYDLLIALPDTDCETVALDLPSITLAEGDIVDVFAIGGANGWPLDVVSITGFTPTPPAVPAVVNVAHFAPFATDAPGTSVTVRLNGADAIPNFEFGDIEAGVELAPGDYLVEIVPTGTSSVAISGTVSLEGGVQYTLAAIGDGANQSLELFPLVDDTTPAADAAKLRVAHLAPFASSDTEVDICTDDGTVVIPDFAYKDVTDPYLELVAGRYDLLIALAGNNCEIVALDIPPIILAEGDIVDVFVIGGANGWPLDVASITGLKTEILLYLPIIYTIDSVIPQAE